MNESGSFTCSRARAASQSLESFRALMRRHDALDRAPVPRMMNPLQRELIDNDHREHARFIAVRQSYEAADVRQLDIANITGCAAEIKRAR
jgi:hypothetical protein